MRVSQLTISLLPAAALAANEQKPLGDKIRGWFEKAADFIPSAVPSVSIPDPLDAGAAKVAEFAVSQLNASNWKNTLLAPSSRPATKGETEEEWLIFVTGGNRTCYGVCAEAEKAWNTSSALLSASTNAPHLAQIDCESEAGILCSQFAVTPPSIYHLLIPRPYVKSPVSGETPPVTARSIHLNHTSVTAAEITAIHSKKDYLKKEPYTGIFHPFDGPLAKYGVAQPVGYALYYFSKMPSWLPMILISFISRSFMGRRMPQAGAQPAAAAPAAAAPK